MDNRILKALALSVAAGALGFGGATSAATFTGSLSDWETAAGTWAETTNYGVPDGTTITGFTTTDGVPVSVDEQVHSIGDGWATWSGGYTGQVLADYSSTSVTYTLGAGVTGFGFFAEPDEFDTFDITLTTADGSLTQAVQGDAGAEFFGWTGSGITSFTVSSSDDFAVGDFYDTTAPLSVPEPAMWAMMLAGIAGLGAALRRRRVGAIAA